MTTTNYVDLSTRIKADWLNDVDAVTYQALGDGADNPPTTPAQVRTNLDVTSATTLASTANGDGASLIGLEDAAGNFTATDVEAALAEEVSNLASTANGKGASLIGVEDAGGDFTATTQEGVNAEIADKLDGTSTITPDIDGGTVDNSDIGLTTSAKGSFTTLRELPPSTSGTDTYTVTTGLGALTSGEVIAVDFATTNTVTNPTLNRDTLGAKTIKKKDGTAVGVGDLTGVIHLEYNGTDYLALDIVPAGTVVQVVNTQDGAVATGTTVLPFDDTIPQNTEGDEYMTLAITPRYSTSKLKIEVVFNGSSSATGALAAALFQDSTANALAVSRTQITATNSNITVSFNYYMTSGTTSSTTFKLRAGNNNAGTTTFNGASGARSYGGVLLSSITITEIKA